LSAEIDFDNIPTIIEDLKSYIDQKSIPGGTHRNWDSYGDKIGSITDYQKAILADPQTSGGLLIAVAPNAVEEIKSILAQNGLEKFISPVGKMVAKQKAVITIK
jgi:selenide,water dikinase